MRNFDVGDRVVVDFKFMEEVGTISAYSDLQGYFIEFDDPKARDLHSGSQGYQEDQLMHLADKVNEELDWHGTPMTGLYPAPNLGWIDGEGNEMQMTDSKHENEEVRKSPYEVLMDWGYEFAMETQKAKKQKAKGGLYK